MSVAASSAARINRLSEPECGEWAAQPTVNPVTKRNILLDGPTYKAIARRCQESYGIAPGGRASASTSASDSSESPEPLPKTVGKWQVPQTRSEWDKAKLLRATFKRLCVACRMYGFVTDRHATNAEALVKIHQLLIERGGIIPEADEAAIAECIVVLVDASAPAKVKRHLGTVHYTMGEYETIAEHATITLLGGNQINLNIAKLTNNLQVSDFNKYMQSGSRPDSEKVTGMLVALEGLAHDIVLMRAPSGAPAPGAPGADAYDLPKSRSRSLPESISQRRVKQKKPRRQGADPEDADEYYPWSATEEAVPTDRSRFRSHAKLSAMSAGPVGPAAPAPLPPLTPKKRTAMLAELRAACTVMKDMISMQRFDRMNKKSLQLVVRLGPADRAGQQRCYYVKNIYQLWANAVKENKPFRDPLTREPVSPDDKDQIMSKVRRIRPDAPDPRGYAQIRDKKLALAIHQINFNYADIVSEQYQNHTPPPTAATDRGTVGFYSITVRRPVGRQTYLILDLGFIPSDIELADVGGDANLTSSAVIGNIQSLFESGQLMISNVIPYRCCRIHMGKTVNYWVQKTSDSPVARSINMRRWKMMATEVYDHL